MCLHPHLPSLAHLLTVTTPAIHYRVTADISTVNLFHWLQAIIYGATLLIYHCDLQCSPSLNSRYPHNKMSKCWYNQLGDLLSQWTLIYVPGQPGTIWAWNMSLILVQDRSDWGQLIRDLQLAMWVIETLRGDGIVLSLVSCLHRPILTALLSPSRWRMKSLLPMSAEVRALHPNEMTQDEVKHKQKQKETHSLIVNRNRIFIAGHLLHNLI